MSTINISLPDNLALKLDQWVERFDFGSRSEFMRAILRRILSDETLLIESTSFPFAPPATKSRLRILKAFEAEKKYSSKFIADLKEGLKNSHFFKD